MIVVSFFTMAGAKLTYHGVHKVGHNIPKANMPCMAGDCGLIFYRAINGGQLLEKMPPNMSLQYAFL